MSDTAGGALTREELIAELARLEPRFHLIDLGQRVLTKTRARRKSQRSSARVTRDQEMPESS